MQLIFTKTQGKYDRLEILRTGRAGEIIDCPKQGIIPHDMVHFAVEHSLQAQGFLHRVKEGETAELTMAGNDSSDAVERLVEVMQADAWSGNNSPEQDLIDLYHVTCHARSCPALPVDAAALRKVRSAMTDLAERWQALAVGESLRLQL